MIKTFYYFISLKRAIVALSLLLVSQLVMAKTRNQIFKNGKNTLYFGQFQNLPTTNFCVLYNGELINIHDASFVIKDNLLLNINILFVNPEKIKFTTEENTVSSLKLETNDYKFYQLAITQNQGPKSKGDYISSWKITEKLIDNVVPANTVLIPLSPNDVDIFIQNVTNKPNNLALKLPMIKLIGKPAGQELKNLMIEGYLKALALKPFHAKQQVKSNLQNATKISMII